MIKHTNVKIYFLTFSLKRQKKKKKKRGEIKREEWDKHIILIHINIKHQLM